MFQADNDKYPRWLRLKDAAKYGAFGRNRLLRLLQAGEIRGHQEGGRGDWIVDRYSIDDFHGSACDHLRFRIMDIINEMA